MQLLGIHIASRLFFTGVTILAGTITIVWVIVPALFHWQISSIFRLQRGSEAWNEWENVTVPIYAKVYIFNITNHENVIKGEIPKIQEIGPYVYEEKRTKEILKEDLENKTVTYKPTIKHTFRADLSNGTEEDLVTILNVPYLSVVQSLQKMPTLVRYLAHIYLDTFDEKPFLHSDVGTILFKGRHYPMIESISEILGEKLLPNNTFAFFYERNGTLDDLEVGTDYTNLGETISWKGQHTMNVWDGPSCNKIRGTDGSIFSPYITKETVLRAFEPEVCRSVHLTFTEELDMQGVHAYKFTVPEEVLSDQFPDNKCYCTETDKSKCPKSGAVGIQACKRGAPLIVSKPYFLDAEYYRQPFKDQLEPNASIHDSYMLIEPTSGVILKVNKRLQFNIQLKPSDSIDAFAHVPDVTVPLLWADEGAEREEELYERLRRRLVTPLLIIEYGKWAGFILSGTLMLSGVILLLLKRAVTTKGKIVEMYEKEKFVPPLLT